MGNDGLELPDGSYSVSDIQDYIQHKYIVLQNLPVYYTRKNIRQQTQRRVQNQKNNKYKKKNSN